MHPQVLSVGSCSADNYRLKRLFVNEIHADMVTADTAEDGLKRVTEQPFDLILVNRIIDWDGTFGVDFIAAAKRTGVTAPMMLVSDYPDAQAQAIANGAFPGFGKSRLHDPETFDLIREALVAKKT